MLFNIYVSIALLLFMYVLFGAAFPLGKLALLHGSPIFFCGIRLTLAGIILLLYQYIFHRKKFSFKKEYLLMLVMVSVFGVFLTNSLEYWGLEYLEAAKTYFIYNFSPVFSAFFSYFIFKELMTMKKWIGLIIGFLGFLPILIHQSPKEKLSGEFLFVISWAEFAVLIAAITTVIGWVYMRKITKDHDYSPVMANGLTMLWGGLLCFPISLLTENWNPIPVISFWPFMGYTLAIMLVANIIGYNIYAHIVRIFTVTFITFVGFLGPIFSAFIAWILLGEVPSWEFFVSGFLVFAGLYLFYQEELRQGYIHN